MKIFKFTLLLVAAVVVTFGLGTAAYAFHSGGVAECMGCHNIHDAASASYLLVGSDASSTCLVCHGRSGASSYHISTPDVDMPAGVPPGNRTPGGDFGWLKKRYEWSPRSGTTSIEEGWTHGHNIVAIDAGYDFDPDNPTAPGGDMDSTLLSCTSCHDQHSKLRRTTAGFAVGGAPIFSSGSYSTSPDPTADLAVGAYRLLRGTGSDAGSGGKTFTSILNAVVTSSYNRTEEVTPTRVAYGAGISDWCATCHPDMHSGTSSLMTHPVNQALGTTVAGIYNAYAGSGKSTTPDQSYDSIVPFQADNTSDYTVLKPLAINDGSNNAGPATSDRVMCLSCHRAHATGWEFMTRWNNGIEMIVINGLWPGIDSPDLDASAPKWAMGRTVAETTKAYNDKTPTGYGTWQRSLCNKCHAKD